LKRRNNSLIEVNHSKVSKSLIKECKDKIFKQDFKNQDKIEENSSLFMENEFKIRDNNKKFNNYNQMDGAITKCDVSLQKNNKSNILSSLDNSKLDELKDYYESKPFSTINQENNEKSIPKKYNAYVGPEVISQMNNEDNDNFCQK